MSTLPIDVRDGTPLAALGGAVAAVAGDSPDVFTPWRDAFAAQIPDVPGMITRSLPPALPGFAGPITIGRDPAGGHGDDGGGGSLLPGFAGPAISQVLAHVLPGGAGAALGSILSNSGLVPVLTNAVAGIGEYGYPDLKAMGCFGGDSGPDLSKVLSNAGASLMNALPGQLMNMAWQPGPDASAAEVAAHQMATKAMEKLQSLGFDPKAIQGQFDKWFKGLKSVANVPVALGESSGSQVMINGGFFANRLTDPAEIVAPKDVGVVIQGNPTVLCGGLPLAGKNHLVVGAIVPVAKILNAAPLVLMGASSVTVLPPDPPDPEVPAPAAPAAKPAPASGSSPAAKPAPSQPPPKPAPPAAAPAASPQPAAAPPMQATKAPKEEAWPPADNNPTAEQPPVAPPPKPHRPASVSEEPQSIAGQMWDDFTTDLSNGASTVRQALGGAMTDDQCRELLGRVNAAEANLPWVMRNVTGTLGIYPSIRTRCNAQLGNTGAAAGNAALGYLEVGAPGLTKIGGAIGGAIVRNTPQPVKNLVSAGVEKTTAFVVPKLITAGEAIASTAKSVAGYLPEVPAGIRDRIARWKLKNQTLPRQSGGSSLAGEADEAYEAIRASTTDLEAIAMNTGIKPKNIEKVKDHLFNDKVLLDRYAKNGIEPWVGRFESNAEIAGAWKRLESGTQLPEDIQLLRHETAERFMMRYTGSRSYDAAHTRAQQRYPW